MWYVLHCSSGSEFRTADTEEIIHPQNNFFLRCWQVLQLAVGNSVPSAKSWETLTLQLRAITPTPHHHCLSFLCRSRPSCSAARALFLSSLVHTWTKIDRPVLSFWWPAWYCFQSRCSKLLSTISFQLCVRTLLLISKHVNYKRWHYILMEWRCYTSHTHQLMDTFDVVSSDCKKSGVGDWINCQLIMEWRSYTSNSQQ